ncbi:tRNA lysidine(34) synthetase TilS [Pedobacter sp.]|uniref:tRNA lysidine(34) synthetase TilS n=1 Tax=Pedobacter sp. TaxID=1411316 RepID=UPI003D7F59A3
MFPLQKFKEFIIQNSLLQAEDRVLLAVSGGRDSVLLVHLFKQAGLKFGIAHCNFNLREGEAQRDENFVKDLALAMEVPFYVARFDTRAYAAQQQVSTQMAARTLRYSWFETLCDQENYDHIAVAHHQNDAIETILLNLVRGTGIAGLHGILPKRGRLIRPLLFLSRAEIDDIIEKEQLAYVEDGSNASDKYARNKIRLQVVPALQAINPNLEQTFEHNMQRFRETEMVLNQVVESYRTKIIHKQGVGYTIALEDIKCLQPQQLLLFELLKPFHFQEPVVKDILQSLTKQSGVSFYSNSHRATIDREKLLITELESAGLPRLRTIEADDSVINLGHQQLHIRHTTSLEYERDPQKAYVDEEKLVFPMVLRYRKDGDRFIPLGMTTFKKLSNYLIDAKVPLPLKDQVPVLENGNGEIVWIAGMRTDNRYKVTSTTKKVAIFELKSAQALQS